MCLHKSFGRYFPSSTWRLVLACLKHFPRIFCNYHLSYIMKKCRRKLQYFKNMANYFCNCYESFIHMRGHILLVLGHHPNLFFKEKLSIPLWIRNAFSFATPEGLSLYPFLTMVLITTYLVNKDRHRHFEYYTTIIH